MVDVGQDRRLGRRRVEIQDSRLRGNDPPEADRESEGHPRTPSFSFPKIGGSKRIDNVDGGFSIRFNLPYIQPPAFAGMTDWEVGIATLRTPFQQEVQDTSWQGFGDVPQISSLFFPHEWGT
jgi:hypothetical protein